ncbi:MAG: hypothetical protein EDS66_12075 [Planctomycetota bacterium]|nr:MAG: hypothetical protein EDS66_12075 [Planctomycetota bacterium]MCQ3921599.1 hypothetical protein [Planctomycetota bacterium]
MMLRLLSFRSGLLRDSRVPSCKFAAQFGSADLRSARAEQSSALLIKGYELMIHPGSGLLQIGEHVTAGG